MLESLRERTLMNSGHAKDFDPYFAAQDGEDAVLSGVNRLTFASCCSSMFLSRALTQLATGREARDKLYEAQRIVANFQTIIKPERYLTFLFELAHTNRTVHAFDEGSRWSEKLQAAAPPRPNQHWTAILSRDALGQRMWANK
jgi:hypothetical protein